MDQDERRSAFVAGFLVMNANAIEVEEARMFGVEDNVTALVPVGVTWTHEQFRSDRERRGRCS